MIIAIRTVGWQSEFAFSLWFRNVFCDSSVLLALRPPDWVKAQGGWACHPLCALTQYGPSWCSFAIWGTSMLCFMRLVSTSNPLRINFVRKLTLPLRVHSAMRFPNACAQFLIEQRSFLIHPFFVFYQTPDRPPLGQLLVILLYFWISFHVNIFYIILISIWYQFGIMFVRVNAPKGGDREFGRTQKKGV